MSREPQKPKVLDQADELVPQIDQATQVFPAKDSAWRRSQRTLIRGLQALVVALETRT